MERLNAEQLLLLKEKLPTGYVRLIAKKHEQQFGLKKNGKPIQNSSIYRGLTVRNYSENIVAIALQILRERSVNQKEGIELLNDAS